MKRWERVTANLREARETLRAHRRACHSCGPGYATHNPKDFPCDDLARLRDTVKLREEAVTLARRERRA